ncbi:hypothetical protein C8R47DRAFT_1251855 [Mycena vitilis]|nr:hypothetical protein C8R47DRAFT_1251855 [Mycena vitilis]
MSEFDPVTVLEILALFSGPMHQKIRKDWKSSVNERLKKWLGQGHHDPQVKRQLEWESNVVEYVDYLYAATRHHGNSNATGPKLLRKGIPIYGPRFVPPTFLEAQKRTPTKIQPSVQYLRPLNVVHPFYYNNIGHCPQCGSEDIKWDSWTGAGSREVHGVRMEEKAIGFQLRCKPCKGKYGLGGTDTGARNKEGEKMGYSFATTNTKFWTNWQHWAIPRSLFASELNVQLIYPAGGIPYFFYRCALTRDLFDTIVELRPSTTSGKLAENFKQLHLLEYKQRHLEYLRAFETRIVPALGGDPTPLESFSAPYDQTEYNDKSITDDLITDVFLEFSNRTRIEECGKYLRTLVAICMNLDNTFKAAGKATVVDESKAHTKLMKGGILSILNERNEIISWRFCQSGSVNEIVELLEGLKARLDFLGVPHPEAVTVDNCCHVRNQILGVLPLIKILLDVYHFMMRYGAVILNGVKNPHRGEVLKDIRDAIIKVPAGKDGPAKYWSQAEQAMRLPAAFDKWAVRGGVWSAAAQNVHTAQMQHVAKGCLARPRDDIATDGSRIESSHKGWNSLQRSVASGLELQTALGHDFVLRRNVRNAFNGKIKSNEPFVLSTFGSHHLALADAAAASWNGLLTGLSGGSSGGSSLHPLPRLKNVNSGEKFGLVNSPNTDTFGGLYTIKSEPEDDLQLVKELDSEEQQDLMQELHLDPVSFLQPMVPTGLLAIPAAKEAPAELQPSNDPELTVVDATSELSRTTTLSGSLSRGIKRKQHPQTIPELLSVARAGSHTESQEVKKQRVDPPLYSLFTPRPPPPTDLRLISGTPAPAPTQTRTSFADLDTPFAQPVQRAGLPKLTPSQRLFSTSTGINPRALKVGDGAEFFLLMNMRAELQWKSFEMTPRRWVEATIEYNTRLQAAAGTSAHEVVRKHPRALVEKLGEIEPKIIQRITNNNFKSAKGGTAFWTKHCNAVSFVKMEPGVDTGSNAGSTSTSKARKQQTCGRCLTIKYPGPKDSAENHKKIYCSDGFKTKVVGDVAAPWPLPAGIFTKGTEFHPFVFLEQVREVYTRLVDDAVSRDDLSLEHDTLMKLLEARFVVDPLNGAVMFKLFHDFAIPAADNVPDDLIIDYNGSKHLLVNCLKN